MNRRTELPFVDEFRWVSPLHLIKNEWQNAVPLWCMSQVGPPSLHYCCAVALRFSFVLPPVGHSSNHEYHCCQLTGQSSSVSNFYHTFKVFIWLCLVSNFMTIRLGMFESFYLHACLILITITYTLAWKQIWRSGVCSSKRHLAACPLLDSLTHNAFLQ
jgi:hypothetical protein